MRMRVLAGAATIAGGLLAWQAATAAGQVPPRRLMVSADHRFLQQSDGSPFFWLGDTAWLLFSRLDRSDTRRYLDDRQAKGFTVIQVMVLHAAEERAANGAPALVDAEPDRPRVTPGDDPADPVAYDYWDHVDWVIGEAASRGLYVALVPAWGSLVKTGRLNATNVVPYATFLAHRYRELPNVVWLVGGDARGNEHIEVWQALGRRLRAEDPHHLISYHPFGRTQSSTWFHAEPWLDFNVFQSGHRRYDQDTDSPKRFGEDNWRYVLDDLGKLPPKPALDGEPSYENIPQGLHDAAQPYWTADDARRYAYWSVFAGACGHTYGNNAVMQFHTAAAGAGAYAPRNTWREALDDAGAGQMRHLKALMLSRPYFERVYDGEAVASGSGERYERLIATKGRDYLFVYSYTGRSFSIRPGRITGRSLRAWWFNPRDGKPQLIGVAGSDALRFTPPGDPGPGNDWVLVLDDVSAGYPAPGTAGDGR